MRTWGVHRCCGVAATLVAVVGPSAPAVSPELLEAVPGDAWAVLAIDGAAPGANGATDTLNAASFLLDQAQRVGLISEADPTTRAVLQGLGSLPVVVRHPYALCLLSGDAQPIAAGGYRLAGLQAALIVQTGSDVAAIEARIQHLLNTYANSQVAKCEPVERGGSTWYRLVDQRLPDWAELAWGKVGDCYVVALGTGAFERVAGTIRAKESCVSRDAWFRAAYDRCGGPESWIAWSFRFDRIREHLQPVMAGRPSAVLDALSLGNVDRGLWAVGLRDRAVLAACVLESADSAEDDRGGSPKDRYVQICRPAESAELAAVIPPQATEYAVVHYRPRNAVLRARDAYLASRSPSARASLRSLWSRVETETGVSVDRDLLAQLGDRIVIHNDPPHPLGVPLLRTVLVEITGSPIAVRTSMDRLLSRLAEYLNRPEAAWSSLKLHRDPDGVWYFQAGLYGPALAVTDRWLVISYSPVALRQSLPRLQGGPRPTQRSAATAEHQQP